MWEITNLWMCVEKLLRNHESWGNQRIDPTPAQISEEINHELQIHSIDHSTSTTTTSYHNCLRSPPSAATISYRRKVGVVN